MTLKTEILQSEYTYPSFGEKRETQIDARLWGLCIGFWRLRGRRRANDERDTRLVVMRTV